MTEDGVKPERRLGPEEIVSAMIAALLLIVLGAQIVLRAVGVPLVWVEEFSTIAFVILVFAGAAAAFHRHEQLDVDLFQRFVFRHVGEGAVRPWALIVLLLQLVFLSVFAVGLVLMARQAWGLTAGTLPGFRYGWLYLGVLLAVLASVARLAGRALSFARCEGRGVPR